MRYVIADEEGSLWGHIFDEAEGEVMTRWVYDREEKKIVDGMTVGGRSSSGQWWAKMSPEMLSDLEESVTVANDDALARPAYWELREANELPEWAGMDIDPSPRP